MQISQDIVFLFLIITPLALCVGIIALVIAFVNAARQLREAEKEKIILKQDVQQKSVKLLEEAHEQALKTINDANRRAQEILGEAKDFRDIADSALQKRLQSISASQGDAFQKAASDLLLSFQSSLQQLKAEDVTALTVVAQNMEQEVVKEMSDFKTKLHAETIGSEKEQEQKSLAAYAEVEKEIQTYKEEKLKKIEEEIQHVVQNISEKILSKQLTEEDHKNLVLQALQDAKAQQNI